MERAPKSEEDKLKLSFKSIIRELKKQEKKKNGTDNRVYELFDNLIREDVLGLVVQLIQSYQMAIKNNVNLPANINPNALNKIATGNLGITGAELKLALGEISLDDDLLTIRRKIDNMTAIFSSLTQTKLAQQKPVRQPVQQPRQVLQVNFPEATDVFVQELHVKRINENSYLIQLLGTDEIRVDRRKDGNWELSERQLIQIPGNNITEVAHILWLIGAFRKRDDGQYLLYEYYVDYKDIFARVNKQDMTSYDGVTWFSPDNPDVKVESWNVVQANAMLHDMGAFRKPEPEPQNVPPKIEPRQEEEKKANLPISKQISRSDPTIESVENMDNDTAIITIQYGPNLHVMQRKVVHWRGETSYQYTVPGRDKYLVSRSTEDDDLGAYYSLKDCGAFNEPEPQNVPPRIDPRPEEEKKEEPPISKQISSDPTIESVENMDNDTAIITIKDRTDLHVMQSTIYSAPGQKQLHHYTPYGQKEPSVSGQDLSPPTAYKKLVAKGAFKQGIPR